MSSGPTALARPFDELAAGYDESFSASVVGRAQRAAVQRRLAALFAPGERVLELGCGTGEDALFLARRGVRIEATDAAPAMVDVARRKLAAAALGERAVVRVLAIEDLDDDDGDSSHDDGVFDGVFSSFGPLNCVADLDAVGRALAARVRPGGRAALCLMGPLVPWEWLWYLTRGRPRTAFRRLAPGGARWRGLRVRYPTPGYVRRCFATGWRTRRLSAVGALVPPSYAERWAARHPRLVARLARWERRFETVPPLPWLADHYLLELERR